MTNTNSGTAAALRGGAWINLAILTLGSCVLLAGLPAAASAQAPTLVPLQGYLTDRAGKPISGDQTVHFALYSHATGGSPLYEEQQVVRLDDGRFTVYLGSVKDLNLSIFRDNVALHVGVAIGDDKEIDPRLALATAPYAAVAEYAGSAQFCAEASTLGGVGISGLARVEHQHAADDINSGTLSTDRYDAYADLKASKRLDSKSADDLLTRAQADARYTPASTVGTTEGFFDPLNTDTDEIALPTQTSTPVATASIDAAGPGIVLAIGTAAVADNAGTSSTTYSLGITRDGDLSNGPSSTWAALPSGAAQTLTVHGVYPVTSSGTQSFTLSATALSGGGGNSRAAHISLVFVPTAP